MNEMPSITELAKMIDHSLLHPTLTDVDVQAGCELARDYGVATACVKPYSINQALVVLAGSGVKVCSVIGFPHGNGTTGIKVAETKEAVLAGASEIDMVTNIGKVKGGDWAYVSREIKLINEVVKAEGALLKVIFENDYLNEEEIIQLCRVCSDVGVAFVKTSTGYGFVKNEDGHYGYIGATIEHLKLMREHAATHVQIKAAGGVRTLDDVLKVRQLGVSRIGATATKAILNEAVCKGHPGIIPNPHP